MRGRGVEWATILRLLGTVADTTGNVVLVEGEPGIGKSLLLAEAATIAASRETAVATGRADEMGRLMPLGPLLWALEESPAAAAVVRSDFPDGPGLLMWLAEQVRTALERRTAGKPLLVTLDDLQWADPATLMALRTLPSRLASRPLAWLLARRTTCGHGDCDRLFDLLEEEGATRISLRPLDDGAVAEVVADTLNAAPGEELAALSAQADGNPFLLLELLTGLREEGAVRVSSGLARLTGTSLPLRVHTAVRRRLDEVSVRTRYLLEATAVLGRSFSPAYAAEMLGETPASLLPALEEALAAGVLVVTPDELAFRHELVWRSIVETVPAPVRQALRQQIGRDSPCRPAPGRQHAAGAAADTLVALSLIAWDEGRLSRALDLAREAAELPGSERHSQPRAVLTTMLTDLWLLDEAEATLARTEAEAVGQPAWSAEIPILRARLDLAAGRFGRAIEQAEAGLTAADTMGAPVLASTALSVLGTASLRAGDLPRAIRYLENDQARGPRNAPSYARLRSELTAGRISEARDGAASGMSSLSGVYDALPRHAGALTSEPAAAAWLVRMALAVRDERRADAVVEAAEGIAWRNPRLPNLSVSAVHARGLRNRDAGALGLAAAEHPDPWAGASAAEDLGVLLGTDADTRDLAVDSLNSALSRYASVDAVRDVARVRGRLRVLGERRRHWTRTDHPVSGWASLTGTERAVCDLVAQGLTNRQAAEQMFISEHTVAFHLRQVFRKLCIHSRVELARLAVQESIHPGQRDSP
ncbi:DNA-binding CsgD family transcriptional regulator [Streptosporangium album]|uniref:DNA-binding CsgD family transcriptional regulator n=1 Tax=Streptosporangium album TaxID=47479 RepID=A0A7W7S412_9ACTN|nr:LuxR family transcriptional regulator [Streptosporangium album]MBB4943102.1 DNA-binding CsgD family transcriptional regulator [Streptosporangium album]